MIAEFVRCARYLQVVNSLEATLPLYLDSDLCECVLKSFPSSFISPTLKEVTEVEALVQILTSRNMDNHGGIDVMIAMHMAGQTRNYAPMRWDTLPQSESGISYLEATVGAWTDLLAQCASLPMWSRQATAKLDELINSASLSQVQRIANRNCLESFPKTANIQSLTRDRYNCFIVLCHAYAFRKQYGHFPQFLTECIQDAEKPISTVGMQYRMIGGFPKVFCPAPTQTLSRQLKLNRWKVRFAKVRHLTNRILGRTKAPARKIDK